MIDYAKHQRIKEMLAKRGWSLSRVAREQGCTHVAIIRVSQGLSRSYAIERRIANALGTTPAALWPERYPHADAA